MGETPEEMVDAYGRLSSVQLKVESEIILG